MGHSWREMDPAGAAAQDKYLERLLGLRDKLRDVPLSEFTCGELEPTMKLFGMKGSLESSTLFDKDFDLLEAKASKLGK